MQAAVKVESTFTTSRDALKPTMSLPGQKDMSIGSSSSSEVSSSSSSSFLDAFAEAAASLSPLSSPSSDMSSSSPVEDDSEPGDEYDEYDDDDEEEAGYNGENESRRRTPPSSAKTAIQNKFVSGQIQGPLAPPKLAPKVSSLMHKTSDAADSSEAFKRAIEKRRYTKRGRRRKLDPEITNLLSSFLREKTAAGVLYTQADVITFVKDLTKGEVVLSNVDVTRYTQRLGFNRRDKPRPAPSSLPPPVPIGPPIAPRVSPRVPVPSSSASAPISTPSPQKTNQRTTRSSAAAAMSSPTTSASVQSSAGTVSQRSSRHSQPPQRSLSSTSHERTSERHHTAAPVSPPSHHVHPGYYPDMADPLVYAAQQQQQLKAYQDYQAHQYMQMMYQHMVHQQMQEMERFQQQQQEQMHLAAQRMAEARHSQPVPSFPSHHYPTSEGPAHYPEHRGPYAEPRARERVETAAPAPERPSWKPQKKASHRLPGHLPSTSSLPMAPVSVKRASNSQPPLPSVRHLLDALAPHVSYC